MFTTGEPQMSDRQAAYIVTLLDRRWVPSAVAGRIIEMLEGLPDVNASGLENLKNTLEREGT